MSASWQLYIQSPIVARLGADCSCDERLHMQDARDKTNGSAAPSKQAGAASASSQTQPSDAEQTTSESPGWLTRLAKASKNFLSLD